MVSSPVSRRQLQIKAASLPDLGFDTNLAAHSMAGLAHDRQPETGSLAVANLLKPPKHLENTFLFFRFNTNPVVFDPQSHIAILRLTADANFRSYVSWHEFHRIVEKISETL